MRFPQYPSRPHASGQARIKFQGQTYYLGRHGTPESHAEYRRLIAAFAAAPEVPYRAPRAELLTGHAVAEYLTHQAARVERGELAAKQLDRCRYSLQPVLDLFAHRPVVEFDQASLELVRDAMVSAGLCRTYVNSLIGCVRACWKWLALRKHVSAEAYANLRLLPDLRRGRSKARESAKVRPAKPADVEATLAKLPAMLADFFRLQLLTGARTGELCDLRPCDLDRSGGVWLYSPHRHKNEHRDQPRTIHLGPQAQLLLAPWLAGCKPDEFVFSPRRTMAARFAERRAKRKSKLTPSQHARDRVNERKRWAKLRPQYTGNSLGLAVARACKAAGVPHWRPYQLRHLAATRIRSQYGPDAARALLGQRSLDATEIYAELDLEKLAEIMRDVG